MKILRKNEISSYKYSAIGTSSILSLCDLYLHELNC